MSSCGSSRLQSVFLVPNPNCRKSEEFDYLWDLMLGLRKANVFPLEPVDLVFPLSFTVASESFPVFESWNEGISLPGG